MFLTENPDLSTKFLGTPLKACLGFVAWNEAKDGHEEDEDYTFNNRDKLLVINILSRLSFLLGC